jgi:hypothetical protein
MCIGTNNRPKVLFRPETKEITASLASAPPCPKDSERDEKALPVAPSEIVQAMARAVTP